jgi:hypothetical protein
MLPDGPPPVPLKHKYLELQNSAIFGFYSVIIYSINRHVAAQYSYFFGT